MTTYYTYRSFEEFDSGKSYIGVRKCPAGKTPETDPYLGSYSDKTFSPTSKEILGVYGCKEEALQAEIDLHKKFDVARNPHFANRACATSTGFSCGMSGRKHTESSKEKLSKSRKSLNLSGPNNYFFGRTHTEETKNKISNSLISLDLKGENNPMYGKKFSEEHREKMSKAKLGEKHPRYMPQDWYHPVYGTVLQKSAPELVRLFPKQNLISWSLRAVANGKQSHHKGWKVC